MRKYYLSVISAVALTAVCAMAAVESPEKTSRLSQSPPVQPSKVVKRMVAEAFTLPVTIEPTQAEFERFEILDANQDGHTWTYMSSGYIKYGYNSYKAADDWAFIPVQLPDADNFVKLSVQSRVQDSSYKESFEVAWGTAADPAAMNVVMNLDQISHSLWQTHEEMVSIPESGLVYIGIHVDSDMDRYGLWIRNISLETVNTPIPLAPEIASSTMDGLEYSAQVTLPSSTIQGKPIAGAVGLSVSLDGTVTADYPDCTPGGVKDIALSLTKGTHELSYAAYVLADGEKSYGQAVRETVRAVSNQALTLPFFMELNRDEFEQDCFTHDANGDGNTWEFSNSEGAVQYSYNSNKADDWIFLPVIDFGARGGAFDLSVDAKCASQYNPESFEVCVGRTSSPEAMTSMLSCMNIKNTIWDSYTGKITISEGGKWYVGIHCISDADQWNLNIANISITGAPDSTPAIPEVKSIDFNGTEGSVTYTLPSLTVENKPLALPVALIVSVDGVEFTRTEAAAAGSDVTVPMTLGLGNHTVTACAFVVEDGETLTGSPAVSHISVRNPEGYAYPLPFAMRPTAGEFETLGLLDANSSGIIWEYNSGADNGKGAMVCRTKENKTSDAWVFFPKVAVTDISRIYTVSASFRAYLEQFPEDFELCIGKEPDPAAMTVLASRSGFNTYLYTSVDAEFIAPEPGEYVIGIHRTSGGDAHTLSVYGISMADSGKSANAPAAVTGLDVISDRSGALSATVIFNMPVKGISGESLDASELLTATVTSSSGATASATALPGQFASVEVGAAEGVTEFTVRVSSPTHGEGESASVKTYCGFDKPDTPTVFSEISEDNMSLTVTWFDTATGANGGAVNTSSLTHNIYIPTDATGEYWTLVAELSAGENSYVYNVAGYALQDVAFVGVAAVNDKGMSSLGITYDVLGTPYPLPMGDDFSDGRYMYSPVLTPTPSDDYSGNWFFDDPGLLIPSLSGVGESALFCVNTAEEHYDHARLAFPKFSTNGIPAARLTLTVYDASITPRATVYADTYSLREIPIGTITCGAADKWSEFTFDLPGEVLGEEWVDFYIDVDFGQGSEAFIVKSYSVRAVYEKQLETTLSAESEMCLGETYTVTGTVTNRSETAQTLPVVKCTLGTGELSAKTSPTAAEIAPGETVSYTYEIAPCADNIGEHQLQFELVDYTDQVQSDNIAVTTVNITAGNSPVVLDLTGEEAADGSLDLSWTAPELRLTGNDDVEDYEPFEYGRNIGPWLNVDGDGADVYGLGNGVSFPGQFEPKAFQVIDTRSMPSGSVPEAFSGSKYFMAVTPEEGPADDWLISPEVKGGTAVSFRLNILSEEYGTESVDVLYSTTGRGTSDFTLLKTFSQARTAWNPLEVTLPSDALYFAFHYRCDDIFGICLDDIFYSPLTDAAIAGYNIYCNGSRVAESHPETRYSHAAVSNGDRFNVSVVTRIGDMLTENPMSNTFVAQTTGLNASAAIAGSVSGDAGCVHILGFNGQSASIYSADGRLVAEVENLSGNESVQLQAGLYLVKLSASPSAVKFIVR